jgi:hypothetical protein
MKSQLLVFSSLVLLKSFNLIHHCHFSIVIAHSFCGVSWNKLYRYSRDENLWLLDTWQIFVGHMFWNGWRVHAQSLFLVHIRLSLSKQNWEGLSYIKHRKLSTCGVWLSFVLPCNRRKFYIYDSNLLITRKCRITYNQIEKANHMLGSTWINDPLCSF